MDQFGVLVESMGFKSQRSSAPMAHLKTKQNNDNFGFNNGFPQQSSLNSSKKPNVSEESFMVDDLDLIFQSKKNNRSNSPRNYLDDFGIGFSGEPFANFDPTPEGPRGSIDLESVFDFSGSSRTVSGSNSPPGRDASENAKGNSPQMVELVPGFGGSSPSSHDFGNNGIQVGANTSQRSTFSADNDPFSVFETARSSTNDYSRSFSEASDQKAGRTPVESSIDELERFARSSTNDYSRSFSEPSDQKAGRTSVESSIDELERFAMGKGPDGGSDKPSEATLTDIRNTLNKDSKARVDGGVRKGHRQELLSEKRKEIHIDKVAKEKNEALVSDSNIDNIFSMDNDSSHVNRPWTETKDPVFDALFNEKQGPKVNNTASQAIEKSSSVTIAFDDFPSLFGDIPSSSGAFQEIEGESEERKRARWNQHIRTQERMAQALAEKNKRDSQSRYEQEEKHRLAETLDYDIKRWSAGKEGNLLALLSSLQEILWPECDWRPVSLTDLIAPTSVKKVYHKATLCVHPDKVQQKGSTLQQKIMAEKVFDILKEAWKKHNTQEPQSHLKMHF